MCRAPESHSPGHDWGAVAAHGAAAITPRKAAKLITIAVPHGGAISRSFVPNAAQQRRPRYLFFFHLPFAAAAVGRDDFAFIESLGRDGSPGRAFPREEMETVKFRLREARCIAGGAEVLPAHVRRERGISGLDDIARGAGGSIRVPTLYFMVYKMAASAPS